MLGQNSKTGEPEGKLSKALLVLHSLKMKDYVYQSKDYLKWHITWKGQMFRISSHPAFNMTLWVLGAIITITLFVINRFYPTPATEKTTEKTIETNIGPFYDSGQYNPSQIAPVSAGDSSLKQIRKTKTKDGNN